MFEVPRTAVSQWYKPSNWHIFAPRAIDIACPHCARPHVTFTLKELQQGAKCIYAVADCPGCDERVEIWIVNPSTAAPTDQSTTIVLLQPEPSFRAFETHIREISERFVSIYNQAAQAEAAGLHELVGIGYRKALEFLIKDYLSSRNPEKSEDIRKQPLQKCIDSYVDNVKLKESAKRAAWLGNDETHYTRKWDEHDIDDLKKLLDITLYWLSMEILSDQYIEEMSNPK